MRELVNESRIEMFEERRFNMEALVESLAAVGVIRDQTSIRVITRYETTGADFSRQSLEGTERGWRAASYDVYAWSYDVEEDLLILSAD